MAERLAALALRSLAFDAPFPMLIADQQQIIVKINAACRHLCGFSEGQLVGAPLTSIYPETAQQDACGFDAGFREFLSGASAGSSFSAPTVRRLESGETTEFFETISALENTFEHATTYLVTLREMAQADAAQSKRDDIQQTFRWVIEAMPDGVVLAEDHQIIDCNEGFAKMVARSKEDIVGSSVVGLSASVQADGMPSESRAGQIFSSVLAGRVGCIEWILKRADGDLMEIEASLSPVVIGGRQVVLAGIRDITARKRIERERQALLDELAEKEELTRLATQASGVVPWVLDIESGRIQWSDNAADSFGISRERLGTTVDAILALMPEENCVALNEAIAQCISTGEPFKLETNQLTQDDNEPEQRWYRTQGQVEYDASGKALKIRGTVLDFTDLKIAQQEITRLAYYDPLTGLANRRLLLDRLQQACVQAVRRSCSGAVLYIDLDRFKLLNDSLGHKTGDDLLKDVGKRLLSILREEDTVARLGGDEFVVLLPLIEGDIDKVAGVVRRVADLLRQNLAGDYLLNGYNYHLSASVGAAIFPQDGERADLILQHADAAMYLAKRGGRNMVSFYHASMQAEAEARLGLEQDLRNALGNGELELYFQPKINIDKDGAVIGAEALLRWNHPVRGMVMPDLFIPVAEETGLIIGIGQWVLESACAQVSRWLGTRAGDQAIAVAVNVSPSQFRHAKFVANIQRIIGKLEIPGHLLTLEITEGTLIDNLEDTKIKLAALQEIGVKISVDDFGTGYSSLYYLKNLPLNELKIDRTYVKDIIEDKSDAAIVSTIMAIAKNLGLQAVAEGVETQAQAELLRLMGCHLHQGYLYARPMPQKEFTEKYIEGPSSAEAESSGG